MRSLVVLVAITLLGCRPNKPPASPATPATATRTLSLDIEPIDASVEVDGVPRGTASDVATLELAPGAHQIVISKPGFEVWRGEVSLETGAETIQVRLVPAK